MLDFEIRMCNNTNWSFSLLAKIRIDWN